MPQFKTSDGLRLVYYTWGDGKGRPLVLLQHGFTAHARLKWEPCGLTRELADAGFRVAALDARGHGASDKPHEAARYSRMRMAQDLSELATHLGAERFDLCGYSMGGYISLTLALQETRLRRLVIGGISAAQAQTPDPARSEGIAQALESDDPDAIPAAFRAFRVSAEREGNDLKALAAVARGNAMAAPNPNALSFTAPTLAFAGADDRLAQDFAAFADLLAYCRAVTLSGDHGTVYDDPLLCSEVVEFLSAD